MILTGFQFRAARRALNLTIIQLHQDTKVLKGVLSRLENTIGNLENIRCSAEDAEILLNYFNKNRLSFPNKNTIVLDTEIEPKPIENNLTRFQFIVARTVAHLSQRKIASYLNLTYSSIYQFEEKPNACYLKSYKVTIPSIINFFTSYGLVFSNNNSISINLPTLPISN